MAEFGKRIETAMVLACLFLAATLMRPAAKAGEKPCLPEAVFGGGAPSALMDILDEHDANKLARVDQAELRWRNGLTIKTTRGIDTRLKLPLEGIFIVQFEGRIRHEWRQRLEKTGARILDYIQSNGYIIETSESSSGAINELLTEGLLRYIGPLPAEAKVEKGLMDAARKPGEIVVRFFHSPERAEKAQIVSKVDVISSSSDPALPFLHGTCPGQTILELASLPFVRWIEEYRQTSGLNIEASMSGGADRVTGIGAFDGTGIRVAVVDSGIARTGDVSQCGAAGADYHPDLSPLRIADEWDFVNLDSNACDDHSHGTRVAGTIGGDGTDRPTWTGIAPGVTFLIYKFLDSENHGTPTFPSILERAAGHDANVCGNSWGGGNGVYTTDSEAADKAVRGEWLGSDNSPQYMVVTVASGNHNGLAMAPSNAKNVIAVGATKDGNGPDFGPSCWCTVSEDAGCGRTDCDAEPDVDPTCELYYWPPTERACWSGHGPVDTDGDGNLRIKPDLMAPGTRQTSPAPAYLYGSYNTGSGTSMAQPVVAGTAALVVDAHSTTAEWPEMVKARLLATAIPMGSTNLYGHGLADAYHAVYDSSTLQTLKWQGGSIPGTSSSIDYTFTVPAGFKEVRVYLTWSDPATTTTEVVNDLDLRVYDGTDAQVGISSTFDDTVEFVKLQSGAPGTWRVNINGYNVPQGPQKFGLCAVATLASPSLSISASSSKTCVKPNTSFSVESAISNSGYSLAGSQIRLDLPDSWDLFTLNSAIMDSADPVRSRALGPSDMWFDGFPNIYYLATGMVDPDFSRSAIWNLTSGASAPDGTYAFTLQGSAYGISPIYASVNVTVDSIPPSDASGLSSSTHTLGLCSNNPDVTFTWTAAQDPGGCGVDGYGIGVSQNTPSKPGAAKDIEAVTTYTHTLATSNNPYYFNLRTVDKAGNWAPTWASWGPFYIDLTDPSAPTNLSSPTHTLSGCANGTSFTANWTKALDAGCGIDGYSVSWTQGAPSRPEKVKVIGDVTTLTQGLSASLTPWYFNIRSVDLAGNWDSYYAYWGPFYIDTIPPGKVSGLYSTTHELWLCTGGREVAMNWSAALDDNCGIGGYSVSFSEATPWMPDAVAETGEVTTYTGTAPDFHRPCYFNIRAVDKAGNWSSDFESYGPFFVGTTDATWSSDAPSCLGTPVSFDGPPGQESYLWDFGDGCHLGVRINEINVGEPQFLELFNGAGYPVNLDGWSVRWTNTDGYAGTHPLPNFHLAPGAYVQLLEGGGAGNDATHIYIGGDILWDQTMGGSATLYDASATAIDFVRFGGDTTPPPSGTAWYESSPLPTPGNAGESLSRDDSSTDSDSSTDWCIQAPTGAALTQPVRNADCPSVSECGYGACRFGAVISEIYTGTIDAVEIHNTGSSAIELADWSIGWTETSAGGSGSVPLPQFALAAGAYVLLLETSGTNDATHIYLDSEIAWSYPYGGSLALLDLDNRGVDFLRWGGDSTLPPQWTSWTEPSALPSPAGTESLARTAAGTDRGSSEDWCLQTPSSPPSDPGPNSVCASVKACPPDFQEDPTRLYSSPGTYAVRLSTGNANGCSASFSGQVVVGASGVDAAPASGMNPAVKGRTVPFSANRSGGTGPFSYLWLFGDGESSTLENAGHIYATGGEKTVTLTVTDAGGCFVQKQLSQWVVLPIGEPSDVDLMPEDPPLKLLSGTQIQVEEIPGATDYHVYGNPIGSWANPLAYCATAHSSTGSGTVIINFGVPLNTWVVVSATDGTYTESGLGRKSRGTERDLAGSNGTIGDEDSESVSGFRCGVD